MTERSLRQKRRASGEPSSLPKVAKLDGALARKVRQVEASLSPSRWPAVAAPSPARRVSTRCLSHCPGLQRMEAQRLQEEALKAFGIVNRQGQRALRARAPPAPSPAPAPQHKGGKQQQPKQQPRRQPQPGGKARGGGQRAEAAPEHHDRRAGVPSGRERIRGAGRQPAGQVPPPSWQFFRSLCSALLLTGLPGCQLAPAFLAATAQADSPGHRGSFPLAGCMSLPQAGCMSLPQAGCMRSLAAIPNAAARLSCAPLTSPAGSAALIRPTGLPPALPCVCPATMTMRGRRTVGVPSAGGTTGRGCCWSAAAACVASICTAWTRRWTTCRRWGGGRS